MKNIYAFVHIEKTAGTSIIHMLRDTFSPGYIDVRPISHGNYWFMSKHLNWYLKYMPWIKVIGGHSVVPYTDLDNNYCMKYFTVFRNPVDRYISQYRYWRSALGENIEFEKFIQINDSWNMQTKKISKNRKAISAIQTLQDKFTVYGVVEHMNLFLYDLSQFFQCDLYMHHRNLTKNKTDRSDELKDTYLEDIISRNQEDLRLYDWVISDVEKHLNDTVLNIREQSGYTHRMLLDYLLRKSYYEPASGMKRLLNGIPYKGSYGCNND